MNAAFPVQPVAFDPIFVEKPWGGRRLASLLNKTLPAGVPIGESWELASLPEVESRVREGPLEGTTLVELLDRWGDALLGAAPSSDGRFPLLIKFLDARQNLSIQVHPKPPGDDPLGLAPGVKHECWYILRADVDARLYIGLRPGVTPEDVRAAAGTRALVHLLGEWAPKSGELYMLPGGTLHALGAGVVAAEIQTPSDITYRAYDWDRVDAAGRPRTMHVEQALRNIRYDVTREAVFPLPGASVGSARFMSTELMRGPRFVVSHCQPLDDKPFKLRSGELRVWIVTQGSFTLVGSRGDARYARGDVILLPAAAADLHLERITNAEWLEVTVPADPGQDAELRPTARRLV